MRLLKKEPNLEKCPILYHRDFTSESVESDFDIRGGEWTVVNNWLVGKNRDNSAAMIISKDNYFGNVMLDFKASTILPCTHDINAMWSGNWDYETNTRGTAYVAGIQGWWHGKVGFEKSPNYELNVATPLFNFHPGKVYHIQMGSIDGHVFIIVDGNLILEVTDPNPIDTSENGKIGFEAYCTQVRFSDLYIKGIDYDVTDENYSPEF